MTYTKQVIIIRKDLKMTKGKMIAQGSHASLGAILNMMKKTTPLNGTGYVLTLDVQQKSLLQIWLDTNYAKICVYVNSEEELLELNSKAILAGIPTCLITDEGLTHFKGVHTKTALALGPWNSEELDVITGHLKLL